RRGRSRPIARQSAPRDSRAPRRRSVGRRRDRRRGWRGGSADGRSSDQPTDQGPWIAGRGRRMIAGGGDAMSERLAEGPAPCEVADSDHLLTTLWAGPPAGTDPVLVSRPRGDDWGHLTWTDLLHRVRSAAGGLVAHGVAPGDRVAIMSPTRMEWLVADLAILASGAVAVPVYDTNSPDQCRSILANSRPRLAFVADPD